MTGVSHAAILASTPAARPPIEVEYLGTAGVSNIGGNVYAATGFDFGDPESSRKLLFAVHGGRIGGSFSLASATIGGQPASVIADAIGDQSGILRGVWLIGVELPAGASGDITLTFSNNDVSASIFGFRTINQVSLTPTDVGELAWDASSTNSRSTSADAPAGGLFIAASHVYHDNGTTVMTGVSLDYTFQPAGAGSPAYYFGGAEAIAEDVVGKTVTVTKSGGAVNMAGGLIAVSFR